MSTLEHFEVQAPVKADDLLAWFDANPATETKDVAIELFCRFFARQDPRKVTRMKKLADELRAVKPPADAAACYWISHGLFQYGGSHWKNWSKRWRWPPTYWRPADDCASLASILSRTVWSSDSCAMNRELIRRWRVCR